MSEKITLKKEKNNIMIKFHIILTIIFFLSTLYVAFVIDTPNRDGDLLFYFYSGKEILYGDPQNVIIFNAPVGWPIILATVDSVINDPHSTSKILSTIFASGIVITTYFIIKNIFDRKVALFGQTIIALNPMLHVEAINSHSEMVPTFLIFLSLYYITKKQLVQKDIVLCSLFLGLSFMMRPQALFVGFGIFTYIGTIIKDSKKQFLAIFILIFILSISPLLIYNITTSGNLIDNDPNFYLSKESTENKANYENLMEAEQSFLSQVINNSSGLEVIFSEYGNNLIHNNPHFLFNLGLGHNNFSIFPLIPFVGILFTIGGILSVFPNIFQKKIIGIIFGIFGSLFLVLFLTENLEKYFLAAIIIPIIIVGLISKNKINSNILSLLIMSTIFMILISIINIKTPHDILAVSIIPIAFSSYFIIKIVPKIFVKIRNKTNTKITNYFLVLMIIIIILMNIPLSIMVQKNLLYGENIDYKNLFENKKYTHTAVEYEEVGIYLSKINGIQNKIIMASERDYAHYANSKFVFTSFNEGKETDTINEFINRDNWSKYEIIESNMASQPPDRKNEHNHQKADYIIIQKNMAINNNIEILKNKNDPKIPTNIELVYESNSNQTLVYKINHN